MGHSYHSCTIYSFKKSFNCCAKIRYPNGKIRFLKSDKSIFIQVLLHPIILVTVANKQNIISKICNNFSWCSNWFYSKIYSKKGVIFSSINKRLQNFMTLNLLSFLEYISRFNTLFLDTRKALIFNKAPRESRSCKILVAVFKHLS